MSASPSDSSVAEPALTRKELRFQARERQIVDAAREILVKDGLPDLTMDRIAEAIHFGRTTIYEHFSCKEEIIAELTNEAGRLYLRLAERLVDFDARPRERMVALGEVSEILNRRYPWHFVTLLMTYTNMVRDKISPERTETERVLKARASAVVEGVLLSAVEVGDLVLPKWLTLNQLNTGLWYLTIGGHAFRSTDEAMPWSGVPENPVATLRMVGNAVLDGLGWRPLSSEWDYGKTLKRVYTEVFPPEVIEEALG